MLCTEKTYTCDGHFTGNSTAGMEIQPAAQCAYTMGAASCVPQPDICSPPEDGSNADRNLNAGCATSKTTFAGQPESTDCGGSSIAPGLNKLDFNKLGADPILVSSRSAATGVFTDFEVARVSRLSLSRVYNSADADLQWGGTGGIFGNAWHHDWEGYLTCANAICTVRRGALSSFRFVLSGDHRSLDDSENWIIYVPYSSVGMPTHHHLLVKRPSREWIAYLSDGRELHFRTLCTSCDGATSASCMSPEDGGQARLVGVVDPVGNAVTVSYDPGEGVLLRISDDLGHSLEVRGSATCGSYASELRYDGSVVARYSVLANVLTDVVDADGGLLRSYAYGSTGQYWPRLRTVLNESSAPIVEFLYDSNSAAVGLVDAESSLSVAYNAGGCHFQMEPAGDGTATYWLLCSSYVWTSKYFRGPHGDTSSEQSQTLQSAVPLDAQGTRSEYGVMQESGLPVQFVTWTRLGAPLGSFDADGHAVVRNVDGLGRVVHRKEFSWPPGHNGFVGIWPEFGASPVPLPDDSREEWREYGLTRAIAQGVNLDLDQITRVRRHSTLVPTAEAVESYDYDQAPSSSDPAGYSCTVNPLPSGSVLCREIGSGFVSDVSGPVLERHATFYSYDGKGRLTRTYGPVNLDRPGPQDVAPLEERAYWPDDASADRQGRLYQVKRYPDPTGSSLVTTYDYDKFGVSQVTAPDGTSASITKDGRGRPRVVAYSDRSATVQAQTETRYYDGLTARLRIRPGGAAERYSYDTKGRLSRVEHLSGDPEVSGANVTAGWSESYIYDQAGNRIHSERKDSQGAVTWQQDRAFDADHHVVWESHPSLPSVGRSWSYTGFAGFLSGTVDEEGRAVTFLPDRLNRVAKVQQSGLDPLGNAVTADVATYLRLPYQENVATVLDGAGRSTMYRYDDFGRVEQVSAPDLNRGGGVWYRYDARGNVIARGDVSVNSTLAYDGLDRLVALQASNSVDGSSLNYSYAYDTPPYIGRLTSITEPERTSYFTYDWAGRLKSEVMYEAGAPVPLTTGYDYDASGSLWQLSYPSGLIVQFPRDPATGDVVEVRNAVDSTKYAHSVVHYPAGPWASLVFGNGRNLSQSVNLRYEPLEVQSGPLWLQYTPTPAGDVGATVDKSEDLAGCVQNVTRTLQYDVRDRLYSWADAVASDPGTCPPTSIGPSAAGFTYVAGSDQLASQQTPGPNGVPAFAFGYDVQGNMSAVGQYGGAGGSIAQQVCLRHDALGRMVLMGYANSLRTPGGLACLTDADVTTALARFKYDARNRRVARQQNSQWTYVVSDSLGNPLSEFTRTGDAGAPWVKLRDYVWLDGRFLAQVEYTGNGGGGPSYVYYAHLDHLGQPRALTNADGQIVWSTFQRPYGEVLEKTTTDPLSGMTVVTNLRLPGQYDERLFQQAGINMQGPYYNWNRWYLPSLGRYMEPDPIAVAGGFNGAFGPDWYAYAVQNPLGYVDPDGLGPLLPEPPGGPPFPVPGGGPDTRWKYVPDTQNGRGGAYYPDPPLPGGRQPGTSWDGNNGWGHWDQWGTGDRMRYDRWGNKLTPEQAHRPRPFPGWLRLPMIFFIDPCVIQPELCKKKNPCDERA